jgi:hypothetical protein
MVDTRQTQPVNHHRADSQHHSAYEHRTQITEHPDAGLRVAVSRVAQLIWLMFGVLEALIGLRIVLKLIAANPANPFANLVYTFTDLFLWPFAGLTITPSAQGMVLEIPAIIAMFVYALVGWVIVKLVWLLFYQPATRTVRTEEHEHEHLTD